MLRRSESRQCSSGSNALQFNDIRATGTERTLEQPAANGRSEPDVIDAAKSANDRYWV